MSKRDFYKWLVIGGIIFFIFILVIQFSLKITENLIKKNIIFAIRGEVYKFYLLNKRYPNSKQEINTILYDLMKRVNEKFFIRNINFGNKYKPYIATLSYTSLFNKKILIIKYFGSDFGMSLKSIGEIIPIEI